MYRVTSRVLLDGTNKRRKNGNTLKMPAKFSYMTEEEKEYGGGSWGAVAAFVIAGLSISGGIVCIVFGKSDAMVITASVLFTVGIVSLEFGFISASDPSGGHVPWCNRCKKESLWDWKVDLWDSDGCFWDLDWDSGWDVCAY